MRKIFIIFWLLFAAPSYAVTLSEMIGQLVLVGFDGKDVQTKSVKNLLADIKNAKVGGVLFLGHNIGTAAQVAGLTKAIEDASPYKTLITIDQEGGRVARIKPKIGAPYLPSAKQMTKLTQQAAHDKYFETAQFLRGLGFNVNFGPVVDLEINKNNPVIAKLERSYGTNVKNVSEYAFMFVDAHHRAGMLTALKHFPGHGSSAGDSHKGFVDVSKTWSEIELGPYKNMIGWKAADMVMAAHVFLDTMSDDGKVPTSLSHIAITDVLRNQLGYDGVVVSDDMAMGAIANEFTAKVAIIKAINAGTDIVMMSSNLKIKTSLGAWVHSVISQAVLDQQISQQTITDAYTRIQKLKNRLP
ncbi:MAG: glycoside hydrolase family 3 protein [OCS116 cluster bacterium]|uniref:beta-N-acetylhexosaminidase n=1 Tax=OCS116 cluster bacterium TaxID=2030921 RepID=A0A2A4Z229_9PROT|nr:glycoside hydrolase family 3 protein [OCS116 cluster bacterium]